MEGETYAVHRRRYESHSMDGTVSVASHNSELKLERICPALFLSCSAHLQLEYWELIFAACAVLCPLCRSHQNYHMGVQMGALKAAALLSQFA